MTDVRTFGATTSQILELIDYLKVEQVTIIVMEATGDYWKPFYCLMEEDLPAMLVNANQTRDIPGRKQILMMRQGWQTLVRMSSCARPSSHQNRSVSYAT